MVAMSIFPIGIMASKARFAAARSGSAWSSVMKGPERVRQAGGCASLHVYYYYFMKLRTIQLPEATDLTLRKRIIKDVAARAE